MRVLWVFLIISASVWSQDHHVLLLGNVDSLCAIDSSQNFSDTLPKSLDSYEAVMLFSNATSHLSEGDIDRLLDFVEDGGGLYSGAENWPLQAESMQISESLYTKKSFGSYKEEQAEPSYKTGNLMLDTLKSIPAGTSTVAFPLDYRLRVDAWVQDQPLILSGEVGNGRLIIDGGYSRFYCNQRSDESDELFRVFLRYLTKKEE